MNNQDNVTNNLLGGAGRALALSKCFIVAIKRDCFRFIIPSFFCGEMPNDCPMQANVCCALYINPLALRRLFIAFFFFFLFSIMANAVDESSFEQVMHIEDVREGIFHYSDPRALYAIRQSTQMLKFYVDFYLSIVFNINSLLQRFFTHPRKFRGVQAATRTLIGGSTCVQFFDRTFYPDSDLDLYVTRDGVYELCKWILDHGGRGYVFNPTSVQLEDLQKAILALMTPPRKAHIGRETGYYGDFQILGVFNFGVPGSTLHIQVIVAAYSALDCILSHHSRELFINQAELESITNPFSHSYRTQHHILQQGHILLSLLDLRPSHISFVQGHHPSHFK